MSVIAILTLFSILLVVHFQNAEGTREPGVCIPYDLPFKHTGFSELCKELRSIDDSEFDALFNNAPNVTESSQFPLRGCTQGCIVGNSWKAYYAHLPENGGSWNGKCFRNFDSDVRPSEVINIILSPDGQYAAEAFPTTVTVDSNSWSRKVKGNKRGVWVLDYSNTDTEFGRDFTVFRDEMRQLSENSIIGKVFTKNDRFAHSSFIPSSIESFTFVLFQVCDEEDRFPEFPYDRISKYKRNERVLPPELIKFSTNLP